MLINASTNDSLTWKSLTGLDTISWKVKFDTDTFKINLGDWDTYKVTWPQPQSDIRTPKVMIREGSYFPEHLGLYLEGVPAIHVGFCGLFPDKGLDGLAVNYPRLPLAHSHPEVGHICFRDGSYIFSAEGVVDDVFIHEYCHILRGCEDCDFEKTGGHDERWKELMVAYGLDPSPYSMYIYR
jgi:hypothetical protein